MTRSPLERLRVTADERGSVLVITVVVMLTLLVFAAYAIDEGIWFVHGGHLQTEADAAALAGAQNFQFPCNSGVEERIRTDVHRYDGTTVSGGGYNKQVPRTPIPSQTYSPTEHNLISLVNQPNFINQSQPNESALTGSPCANKVIDVKLSETNLPSFFPFGNPKYINAQAQVSIEQQTSSKGVSPLAVAETAPVAAKAYFVNEDSSNKVIAESKLIAAANGQEWSSEKPVAVAVNKTNATTAHIGVVIALSGNTKNPAAAGELSAKCREAFVQCYDAGSTGPLLHIAGYSKEGTGSLTAPLARQVTLSKPSTPEEACTDGYFSNSTANCKFAVSAKVDYGSTSTTGITVTPIVAGQKSSTHLEYQSNTKEWTGTATHIGSGSNEISLLFACNKTANPACKKAGESKKEEGEPLEATIKDVQRIYAAGSEHSGPITAASVSESGGQPGADSFQVCELQDGNSCTHNLAVTINVSGSLANAQNCATEAACKEAKAGFFDPLYKLKVEGNGGTIYECRPGENSGTSEYRTHLEMGCPYSYKLNELTAEGLFSDPNCTAENPYDCITVGGKGNHNGARSAITARIRTNPPAGTVFGCSKWQNENEGKVPKKIAEITETGTDSRLVEVFVIPYGAINEEGIPTGGLKAAPIQNFATFYVTGFQGDSAECLEKGDSPEPSGFELVGHFIKYVSPSTGEGSGLCSENAFGNCIAVLTK
jgi:Putative Flp pilus-assembly TadE/G-like